MPLTPEVPDEPASPLTPEVPDEPAYPLTPLVPAAAIKVHFTPMKPP